jgi:mRNA interferase RelE/StbE
LNEPQRRWTIASDRQPQKEIRHLPTDLRKRIDRAILAPAEDPRPAGCKPVKDGPRGTYRLRVGAYRVIYTVLDSEKVIVVASVRKWDESTYQGL